MQLMAEDDEPSGQAREHSTTLSMLGKDDIKTSIYEGGLKTWECSLDLVTYLGNNAFLCQREEGNSSIKNILEVSK